MVAKILLGLAGMAVLIMSFASLTGMIIFKYSVNNEFDNL